MKLIYFEKYGRLDSYNLKDDIREEKDLSTTNVEKTKEMVIILTKKLKGYKAQLPKNNVTGKPVPWPDEIIK